AINKLSGQPQGSQPAEQHSKGEAKDGDKSESDSEDENDHKAGAPEEKQQEIQLTDEEKNFSDIILRSANEENDICQALTKSSDVACNLNILCCDGHSTRKRNGILGGISSGLNALHPRRSSSPYGSVL
ncbi:MAG: hypothetical protein EZS28_024805, partial [Streblomastix strix]